MNAINIPAKSKALNDLLTKASRSNLLLRTASGEQFVLAKVSSAQTFYVGRRDEFGEEIKTTRANKKLMSFLDKRAKQAKQGKLIPLAEVEKKLGLKKRKIK